MVVVCFDGLSQCWGVFAALGWLDKKLCLLAGMDLYVLCSIASLMLFWKIFQDLLWHASTLLEETKEFEVCFFTSSILFCNLLWWIFSLFGLLVLKTCMDRSVESSCVCQRQNNVRFGICRTTIVTIAAGPATGKLRVLRSGWCEWSRKLSQCYVQSYNHWHSCAWWSGVSGSGKWTLNDGIGWL